MSVEVMAKRRYRKEPLFYRIIDNELAFKIIAILGFIFIIGFYAASKIKIEPLGSHNTDHTNINTLPTNLSRNWDGDMMPPTLIDLLVKAPPRIWSSTPNANTIWMTTRRGSLPFTRRASLVPCASAGCR